MFSRCSSLKELNLNNFNTNNVTDMNRMFYGCSNDLIMKIKTQYKNIKENEEIKIIRIIIDYQVESFEKLFLDCECVESLTFKKFYRNNINNMSLMFCGCSSIKELNLNNFNTNNVTDMSEMFNGCSDELKNKIKEQIKDINFDQVI